MAAGGEPRGDGAVLGIGGLELVVLILASFRLTHLLVFDTIAEPLRRWVSAAPAQGTGAAYGYPPGRTRHGPIRAFLATLVQCYWCAGVWVSAGLLLSYLSWPSPVMKGLLLILAIAGGQALLESATSPQR